MGGTNLCLLGTLLHIAALQDTIEFEAAIVVDGREGVEVGIAAVAG